MPHNRPSQLIIASPIALQNSNQQLEHILECEALFQLVHVLRALFYEARDQLAGVPVDQDDPSVNQILFALEFNLDCLEHLNCLQNSRKQFLSHWCLTFVGQDKERLQRAFDLDGQLAAICNQIGPNLHEGLVFFHVFTVLEVVRVHLCNPLDQSDIVAVNLSLK